MENPDLSFDYVKEAEISRALDLEQKAASFETLLYRQKHAGELFLGAYLTPSSQSASEVGNLIGFICSTVSASSSLTRDSMSRHESDGEYICIHSVCVDRLYRRKGIGLRLLKEYVRRARESRKWNKMGLITPKELIQFYEEAGFELVGKSELLHGTIEWFEMSINMTKIMYM